MRWWRRERERREKQSPSLLQRFTCKQHSHPWNSRGRKEKWKKCSNNSRNNPINHWTSRYLVLKMQMTLFNPNLLLLLFLFLLQRQGHHLQQLLTIPSPNHCLLHQTLFLLLHSLRIILLNIHSYAEHQASSSKTKRKRLNQKNRMQKRL